MWLELFDKIHREMFLNFSLWVFQSHSGHSQFRDQSEPVTEEAHPPTHTRWCCLPGGRRGQPPAVVFVREPAAIFPRCKSDLSRPQLSTSATTTVTLVPSIIYVHSSHHYGLVLPPLPVCSHHDAADHFLQELAVREARYSQVLTPGQASTKATYASLDFRWMY